MGVGEVGEEEGAVLLARKLQALALTNLCKQLSLQGIQPTAPLKAVRVT
jgi:hypothetical protein